MSRFVCKRFPGESVVIDRTNRLTVNCVRGDGPQNVAVSLTLTKRLEDDLVSTLQFGLSRGNVAPVGAGITVELQRAYGGRCWLLFEGPREVSIVRSELADAPPATAAAGPIARMAAAISFAWLGLCLWWSCADETGGAI